MEEPATGTPRAPLTHALIGSASIGLVNAVPVGVCLAVLNAVVPRPGMSLVRVAVLAVVTGVCSGVIWALVDRHLQSRTGTQVPQGWAASANYLVTPPVVGLVVGLASATPSAGGIVASAAFLGSLPEVFIMRPWTRDHDPEQFERANAEFGEMTRKFWSEHRDEVAAEAARRTHERELRHQGTIRPENRPTGPVRRRDLD